MDPYAAPQSSPFTIGQSGIPFGGGQFEWAQLPNGGYGWRAPDGRSFDANGNRMDAAPQQAYQAQAPGQPQQGLQGQTQQASTILDFLKRTPPNKVQTYSYNRLPTSARQTVLAGYEALGYDKGDTEETIQKLLPSHASGPSRGYVAPMGR